MLEEIDLDKKRVCQLALQSVRRFTTNIEELLSTTKHDAIKAGLLNPIMINFNHLQSINRHCASSMQNNTKYQDLYKLTLMKLEEIKD